MKSITLGVSPIDGTIYAGKLNKDKTMWVGEKQDVTEDAVRSVFEKMMQESKRKKDSTIEYSYPSFGKISFVPKNAEDNERGLKDCISTLEHHKEILMSAIEKVVHDIWNGEEPTEESDLLRNALLKLESK